MPLLSGTSDAAIHENIRELMHAGHPQDQAIAAAYAHARRQKDGITHLKTAKRPSLSPTHPFNSRKAPSNRTPPLDDPMAAPPVDTDGDK